MLKCSIANEKLAAAEASAIERHLRPEIHNCLARENTIAVRKEI